MMKVLSMWRRQPSDRDSEFELLRILSQFFIVLFHILMFWVYPSTGNIVFKGLQIPLHTGVVIFVLISGYFNIHASSKGLLKLLAIFTVYSIPEIAYNIGSAQNIRQVVRAALFLSNSHFWFIKSYLFLYLLSPFINLVLERITDRQRWYLIAVLLFICQYMAMLKGDHNMVDGTTVTNFALLYIVGDTLRKYKDNWQCTRDLYLIVAYLLLTVITVAVYCLFNDTTIGRCLWLMSYPYSSPLLLLSSILVLMMVGKHPFKSRAVNFVASSSLAIYLIHGCRPFSYEAIGKVSTALCSFISEPVLQLLANALFAAVIIALAVLIDNLLNPVWNAVACLSKKLYDRFGY